MRRDGSGLARQRRCPLDSLAANLLEARTAIKDNLANISQFEAVSGTLRMNIDGDPQKSAVVIRINDNGVFASFNKPFSRNLEASRGGPPPTGCPARGRPTTPPGHLLPAANGVGSLCPDLSVLAVSAARPGGIPQARQPERPAACARPQPCLPVLPAGIPSPRGRAGSTAAVKPTTP